MLRELRKLSSLRKYTLKSHKFKFVTASKIEVGNIVSCSETFLPYKITTKTYTEELRFVRKYKSPKKFIYKPVTMTYYDFQSQLLPEFNSKCDFSEEKLTFRCGYEEERNALILDTDKFEHYYHVSFEELIEGDIVLSRENNQHYQLLNFVPHNSMDYGGERFDYSYFESINLETGKKELFGVGEWNFKLTDKLVILQE
jgi:hypothetical protein